MKRLTAATVFILFLIPACSLVPKKASHSVVYQQKLQSTDHWRRIANRIGYKIEEELLTEKDIDYLTGKIGLDKSNGYISGDNYSIPHKKNLGPVCISTSDNSEFGRSIQSYLKQSLFNKGINFSCSEKTPYHLDWEVSINTFNSKRYNHNPGLVQILLETPVYIIFGGNEFNKKIPHTELLLTFIFKNKFSEKTLLRDTNLFYINDNDSKQYWVLKSEPSQYKTTGVKNFNSSDK